MKKISILCFLAVALEWNLGCNGNNAQAVDDKQLRAAFQTKDIDMSKVPPEKRAMVQGFIDRAKAGQALSKTPAGGK